MQMAALTKLEEAVTPIAAHLAEPAAPMSAYVRGIVDNHWNNGLFYLILGAGLSLAGLLIITDSIRRREWDWVILWAILLPANLWSVVDGALDMHRASNNPRAVLIEKIERAERIFR